MNKISNKCEDEQIHLLGLIQPYGILIILDKDLKVKTHSQVIEPLNKVFHEEDWLDKNIQEILRLPFEKIQHAFDELSEQNQAENPHRFSQEFVVEDQEFYLSMYWTNGLLYLEFEVKHNKQGNLNLSFNSYLQKISQSQDSLWQDLSDILGELMGFDRVMIYQFLEDSSGIVVAEHLKDQSLSSFLGFHYPEFDIPQQARALYSKNHIRFIVDTDVAPNHMISIGEEIDLQRVGIRSLSPIHLQYLRNGGFRSSLSISIIVKGKLWGLVCCQNEMPLHVDLQRRNLAFTLTHYAASRFQYLEHEEKLTYLGESQKLESQIKEAIYLKNNVFRDLEPIMPQLMEAMISDGIAIIQGDEIMTFGETPGKSSISNFISSVKSELKDIYLSNLHDKYSNMDSSLFFEDFPGIAFLPIEGPLGFTLIWFRKETPVIKKWAGKPEKDFVLDEADQVLKPSPRTSFQLYMEEVKGSAIKWTQREVLFLQRIKDVLQQGMLKKASRIAALNEQLIEMNNALDTYAYTISHDLKNPLTAIKLSGEFLSVRDSVPDGLKKKMTQNILDGVNNIVNMLDKIHSFSKASVFDYQPVLISTDKFIKEIVEIARERYSSGGLNVSFGELLPVYGEKTLVYQLFVNIIGNAIKYSSKSKNPTVSISSEQLDNGVNYKVIDNGIGIKKSELETVYEIFKRMSNSAGFEGSGVGMAIVKRIVDKLNLKISIESNLGVGTEIVIFFPDYTIDKTFHE
ncbi:ATP-binding protein [Sphingobacterium sp. CZ-2]|uniref:ATP-binding protein n=1 Tax=Sphingobacterium sp. CZ-2 TaxID=2557994 RepID=UPI00106F3476|nr:ATP-binding protein [Sphingobacterium sp. CZ-2]QBR13295.1 GAF domain-containing protein [Sphingobacterium sp. CZ-2]